MESSQGSQKHPSSSSSHRLPTVSASQALQGLRSRGPRAVSTGLPQLDKLLSSQILGSASTGIFRGGFRRGQVTEVYGPPGVGKTALAITAAVNALLAGNQVVWIDAAAPLVPRRLNQVLHAARSSSVGVPVGPSRSEAELQGRFHHYATPTLAHLLAILLHAPPSFPPGDTGLLVIDSLSTLFDDAYPRNLEDRTTRNKSDNARWAAGRKFAVMNGLMSKLGRTAALHDTAVLFTCQTITRIRPASGALLLPAISGTEWDNGVSTRLVLFRDWIPLQGKWGESDRDRLHKARFVGVLKTGETVLDEAGVGTVVPFTIERSRLHGLNTSAVDITAPTNPSPVRPPKRPFTEIADSGEEEADSDELYGWVEDDEVAAEGLIIDEKPPA